LTKIIRLEDGTKYVASPKKDVHVYAAPQNPPNTGSRYTSGTDLYAHATTKHGYQFYLYDWSMWQGSEDKIIHVTKDEAIKFLESVSGDYNGFPDSDDLEELKEYGIDLAEETA
jgi:hypothetical protein